MQPHVALPIEGDVLDVIVKQPVPGIPVVKEEPSLLRDTVSLQRVDHPQAAVRILDDVRSVAGSVKTVSMGLGLRVPDQVPGGKFSYGGESGRACLGQLEQVHRHRVGKLVGLVHEDGRAHGT